ncbi:hypothetical protein DSO57_1000900 [Entomophthora muscae]|uniref:Uncharacterized protein n=1 Tax=Entomophthora muscae TaxID=34485 RepID=A0ACC2SY91_9FUNG|nr:hypothetical protein DSO57_1000900 [Entomophthora muscae]
MPDTSFSGNELHQVLEDDMHMEATKEVSKPYACQLLDNTPDVEPQRSGDATSLRGVNMAIPIETMKDHHPELCNSIVKFPFTANNLDIHFVVNAAIHHVLILPLLGNFEDKSLSFAFALQNESGSKLGNSIVQFPDFAQLTCPTHACDK